jgi:hypothetical protein
MDIVVLFECRSDSFHMVDSFEFLEFGMELPWTFMDSMKDSILVARAMHRHECVQFYLDDEEVKFRMFDHYLYDGTNADFWFHVEASEIYLHNNKEKSFKITKDGLTPSFRRIYLKDFFPKFHTDEKVEDSVEFRGKEYFLTSFSYLRTQENIIDERVVLLWLADSGPIWLSKKDGDRFKISTWDGRSATIFFPNGVLHMHAFGNDLYILDRVKVLRLYNLQTFQKRDKSQGLLEEFMEFSRKVSVRREDIKRQREELEEAEEEFASLESQYNQMLKVLQPATSICHICCEQPRDHILRPCNHTYCKKCAETMVGKECAFCKASCVGHERFYNN